MTNVIADNIKGLALSAGLSANKLARMIEVTPSAVSRLMISGRAHPRTLAAIARVFGITAQELTAELIGKERLGAIAAAFDRRKEEPPAAAPERPQADRITMRGDAMAPLILDGDTLQISSEIPRSGDVVLATAEGFDTPVVRRYVADERQGWLVAVNPDYLGPKTVRAGRVIAVVTARTTSLRRP